MDELILFWHRRDLRLQDNLGLYTASTTSRRWAGVFCLDPLLLEPQEVAPARLAYLLGSLHALGEAYRQLGSYLFLLRGAPEQALPTLAHAQGAQGVFWNLDVEPYARDRDQRVREALAAQGIAVRTFWDQPLHSPLEVQTGAGQPYTVYTPFWRNWSSLPKATPVPLPCPPRLIEGGNSLPVPTLAQLGFTWTGELLVTPGATAAQAQLREFCAYRIQTYKELRDFPAQAATSLLSAAIKFGTLGPREIWAATQVCWEDNPGEPARIGIQAWRQELAWREFYQHALYHFPALATECHRPQLRNFPWENNLDYFQAWCAGETGYPLVDAAMRQLRATGWMHNRCRMVVASFLTKDLLVDWRWGERYFMAHLVDGDLAANNGGWQWSASSGLDPHPLRIFNPTTQSQKFDPEAEYLRIWLPELRSLDPEKLGQGLITPLERHHLGYPSPIVDHHRQQLRFKQLYQAQKSGGAGV